MKIDPYSDHPSATKTTNSKVKTTVCWPTEVYSQCMREFTDAIQEALSRNDDEHRSDKRTGPQFVAVKRELTDLLKKFLDD